MTVGVVGVVVTSHNRGFGNRDTYGGNNYHNGHRGNHNNHRGGRGGYHWMGSSDP